MRVIAQADYTVRLSKDFRQWIADFTCDRCPNEISVDGADIDAVGVASKGATCSKGHNNGIIRFSGWPPEMDFT